MSTVPALVKTEPVASADDAANDPAIWCNRRTPAESGAAPRPVQTFFEHAERRGLSTGIVTNMPIWDATPAACYAHAASRKDKATSFAQLLSPRLDNGVDIVVGRGRTDAGAAFASRGTTAKQVFAAAGYRYGSAPALLRTAPRAGILRDEPFAPLPVVEAAIRQLSRNAKGYVLMVERGMHTDDPAAGLRHVVEMDGMIRRVQTLAGPDTLVLFTADHSFGLRMSGGTRDTPLADQYATAAAKPGTTLVNNPIISVEDGHTGEEVIAAAAGPGAA